MYFQPFVLWQVQQLLPVTNASPEQGIFNPEQDFDKAAEPTFGRNPRPADENLHRRHAKQPDGLSQGFAAVAISANPPHFMSWSSALTENFPLRLSAYVYIYSNSNLLFVACSILILFLAPTLITFSRILHSLYCKQASLTLTHTNTHTMHLDCILNMKRTLRLSFYDSLI